MTASALCTFRYLQDCCLSTMLRSNDIGLTCFLLSFPRVQKLWSKLGRPGLVVANCRQTISRLCFCWPALCARSVGRIFASNGSLKREREREKTGRYRALDRTIAGASRGRLSPRVRFTIKRIIRRTRHYRELHGLLLTREKKKKEREQPDWIDCFPRPVNLLLFFLSFR